MSRAWLADARQGVRCWVRVRDRPGPGAVPLQPTPPRVSTAGASGDDQAWALARWEGTGAAPRAGEVLATLGSPAGSMVTVWLDASGELTRPPLQPGQITARTIAAAAPVPAVLALSLLTALWLASASPTGGGSPPGMQPGPR